MSTGGLRQGECSPCTYLGHILTMAFLLRYCVLFEEAVLVAFHALERMMTAVTSILALSFMIFWEWNSWFIVHKTYSRPSSKAGKWLSSRGQIRTGWPGRSQSPLPETWEITWFKLRLRGSVLYPETEVKSKTWNTRTAAADMHALPMVVANSCEQSFQLNSLHCSPPTTKVANALKFIVQVVHITSWVWWQIWRSLFQ